MAKVLTDAELADVIARAVQGGLIEEAAAYEHFLQDLGELVSSHFGGMRGSVGRSDGDFPWSCAFHIDESVPDDGGVYAAYDQDVTWADGEEATNAVD